MTRIVLVTGGFDPLHSGHIALFKHAKRLGNKLVIGLNSDAWLARKKGAAFMPFSERAAIIKELKVVDDVIDFDDSDGSANNAIYKLLSRYGEGHKIVFANGGDRTPENIPEYIYKNTPWVEFAFGVGGEDKKNSSSWILQEWKNPKTIRDWGYWRVLDNKPQCKVKELVIEPGKSLSYQRHFKRSEHWYVLSGTCTMKTTWNGSEQTVSIGTNQTYIIGKEVWHKAYNNGTEPCHILEVQYGELCTEEDIERKD